MANFIQTARRFFSRRPDMGQIEERIRNLFNESFLWALGGGETLSDENPEVYVKEGYNINPLVYAVVNQMATKTSAIPFCIKKVKDKDAKRKLDNLKRVTKYDTTIRQAVKMAVLENKAFEDADLPFPMDRPNATQSWAEFMSLYKTFLKLTGNVYIYMLSPEMGMNAGEPAQVYILPSHLIQIIVKEGADMLTVESPIQGYMLTEGRSYIEFQEEDVIHIKYSNPNFGTSGEHLYGQSPLRAALKNIDSSNSGLNLNVKTLKSGGAFGFIHPRNMAITPEQAKELKERLLEMNSSPEDLSKIAGSSVDMDFTRISLTSDELKPFDYLKFDLKMICNVLIWSDKLMNNDEGAKYDNVNQYRKQVVTDNIQPDLKLFSQAMNEKFLPRFKGYQGTSWEFDLMELPEMQTDIKELTEWLNNALDRGVINRNEYRAAIQYPEHTDADMDVFTVQNDILSLGEALDNTFNIQ